MIFISLLLSLGLNASAASLAPPAAAPSSERLAVSELPKDVLRGNSPRIDSSTKLILLDFWASWCEPCRASLPYYDGLQKKYAAKGVTFVGVSADETQKEAQEFLKDVPFSFSAIWDRDRVLAKKLKLDAIPVLIAIASDGRILGVERGFTVKKEKSMPQQIDKWLLEASRTK